MYHNLHLGRKHAMIVHVIFVIFRWFLIFLVLFFHEHPFIQLVLFLSSLVVVIIIKIIIRPYNTQIKNVQDCFGTMLIFSMALLYLSFLKTPTELVTKGKGRIFGWVCISVIFMIISYFYIFAAIVLLRRFVFKRQFKISPDLKSETKVYAFDSSNNKLHGKFL